MSRLRFWPFERMYRLTPRGVWYELCRWLDRRQLRAIIRERAAAERPEDGRR